jgi:putative hemolysin
LEKKGSKRARHVKKILLRINDFLATILIGNTLVNAAAASLATFVFVSFIPHKNQAVLFATIVSTLLILFFSEINPKMFAAHNPLRVAFLFAYPIKFFMLLFYPIAKVFTFLSGVLFRSPRGPAEGLSRYLNEEEVKILLSSGTKGLSSLRKKMIAGVLDIGSRPIKEIMVPRPQVKAIEIDSTLEQVLAVIRDDEFSRYPVYKGRMDNIEGLLHAKDVVHYIIDNKEFNISSVLRKPFFIPELATVEKALLQMQENAVHMAFVVDEFGSMEGIVTLEDIIEEIVGDIQDEHDAETEDWITQAGSDAYIIKGSAPVKDINQRLPLSLPEKADYSTLAGFFLYEFGRIPREKDRLEFRGHVFIVERMNKRHISLVRTEVGKTGEPLP